MLLTEELDVPEDDTIPDLPDVCSLSEYNETVISYIAGFVVKKMKENHLLALLTGINN